MKYINFLFHIYQPPVQSETMLRRIVRESYDPLLRQMAQYPNLKFTLNINYCLVELMRESFPHLVKSIRELYEGGADRVDSDWGLSSPIPSDSA